jgi:hypothetical protein
VLSQLHEDRTQVEEGLDLSLVRIVGSLTLLQVHQPRIVQVIRQSLLVVPLYQFNLTHQLQCLEAVLILEHLVCLEHLEYLLGLLLACTRMAHVEVCFGYQEVRFNEDLLEFSECLGGVDIGQVCLVIFAHQLQV